MTASGLDLDQYHSAIAAGDAQAFGDWMSHAEFPVRDSLRGFAAQVDTESVVQETMLRIWQVAPRVTSDGKPNALLRMAMRIARNLAISETRRLRTAAGYQHSLPSEADQAAQNPHAKPPDPILRSAITDCRERLPARPAQALSARLDAGGGEPDQTLATRLGMRKNTFLQNVTRARKLLAACLAEKGVDLVMEIG